MLPPSATLGLAVRLTVAASIVSVTVVNAAAGLMTRLSKLPPVALLIVADTLPVQIDQMKEGYSLGQVGQRPFEMGYKTMFALKDIKEGKAAPADPTYTGLDVCTPETADTCIGK